jgi:predicted CoA-binding protein
MTKKQIIDDFIAQKDIAIVGCSRDSKKFGSYVLKELKQKGYELYPIHREVKELDGYTCFSSLAHIPEKVKTLIIVTPSDQTEKLVKEAADKGIERIWMQQGAESRNAIQFCQENNIPHVSGECIMMFAEPVSSIHKVHRFIWKLIGKYPKN